MDLITLLLAVAGGAANGTFPIFIKTRGVLAANVHPVTFQMYKSSWVAIFGVSFVLGRLAMGLEVRFTWWAFASAAAWIPSGVCTIIAVPLIGVGSAVLTTAAVGSALSFLVFWLIFKSPIKLHEIGGHEYAIAPYYMLGSVVGMVGLVYAHQVSIKQTAASASNGEEPHNSGVVNVSAPRPLAEADSCASDADAESVALGHREDELSSTNPNCNSSGWPPTNPLLRVVLGYTSAAISGVFSSLQFGLVQLGHRACDPPTPGAPPPPPDERFNTLGSWLGAFGVSAVFCTLSLYRYVHQPDTTCAHRPRFLRPPA